ncbi:hypothetical protein [Paraglaciecola sp. 20A4]|uniref:hypothetical protein n=1 Tax=Paraglaciecola sp. 20A4 TaxID=2687288 RepID=UPI00140BEEE2|nr:hypothetical protein [Paraglaciecola sp. 20A4]
MRCTKLLVSFLVLGLSACAQQNVDPIASTELEKSVANQPFAEKCEDAKYQLDKSVEEGQLSGLRELKRNIELYCVWRRN